jgi:hypothetical protein
MGEITLYPDRLVARWYQEEETVWPASVMDLSKYFFYSLEIDPAFTFGDLIRLLDHEDVEFLETVIGERVEPLLREARTRSRSDADSRIDFLRVYNVHQNGFLRREFDGWGAWDEPYDGAWEHDPAMPRIGGISVSLTPVCELLHLPLRYDPELVFRAEKQIEEYRSEIDITFIEFLKAIFFDLTFHGGPEERDSVSAELRRRVDEIERGEAKLIPADELFKELGLDQPGSDADGDA